MSAHTAIRPSFPRHAQQLESQPVMNLGSYRSWYQPFRTAPEGSFSSFAAYGLLTTSLSGRVAGSTVTASWFEAPTFFQTGLRFGASEEEGVGVGFAGFSDSFFLLVCHDWGLKLLKEPGVDRFILPRCCSALLCQHKTPPLTCGALLHRR